MRIVLIPGVWENPLLYGLLSNNLEGAFKKQFPEATFIVEHCWYSPWEGAAIRRFADKIVETYDDGGDDILLLGYSMGGVIATAVAPRFEKTRVHEVVTVFAPNTFMGEFFSWMCDSGAAKKYVPVVSCAALFDSFVSWGAKYPGGAKHEWIESDHLFGLAFSSRPAEAIARAAVLY